MIKIPQLSQFINKCLDSDLKSIILMNIDGSIISFAGDSNFSRTVSSIISNVWFCYDRHGRPVGGFGGSVVAAEVGSSKEKVLLPPSQPTQGGLPEEKLDSLCLNCQYGKVCVNKIGKFILVCVGVEDIEMGLLRWKCGVVKNELQNSFDKLHL